MDILTIIPAHYHSSRLATKVLLEKRGKTVLQTVYENVGANFVATDSPTIEQVVRGFGGNIIHTGEHNCGTNRIAEAILNAYEPDYVINVQADEVEITEEDLEPIKQDANHAMAIRTLYSEWPVANWQDCLEYADPNNVKVALTVDNMALYFSRRRIPGKHHIGVYGYSPAILQQFCKLEVNVLAKGENLEQLRWLEAGFPIKCFPVNGFRLSLNSERDYETWLRK